MPGLSPKLPVTQDPVDGFSLTKTYTEMIQQNFKNLMLTSPGERIMIPDFGVGLRNFLFEPMAAFVFSDIEERIRRQVALHMPFVQVVNVFFSTIDENEISNALEIKVEYNITPLSVFGIFETTVKNT